MKQENLISIICPIYNSAEHLDESIVSVVHQTSQAWELILVDDGSTDGSGVICDEFARKDNRIRVIHKKNEGQMNARIDGIKYSSGEYIMFLDSDDILNENAVKLLREQIQLFPNITSFVFNAEVIPNFANNKKLPTVSKHSIIQTNKDIIQYAFGDQLFGYLWMFCFKKEILLESIMNQNLFLNVRYTEDSAFIYNVLTNANSMRALNLTLYNYRHNQKSITNNLTINDRRDRFLVFNYIYSDLCLNNKNFRLNNKLAMMVSWSIFSYVQNMDSKSDLIKSFKESRKSFLFKKICKKAKSNDKVFSIYRFLMTFNLPSLFYKYSRKQVFNCQKVHKY